MINKEKIKTDLTNYRDNDELLYDYIISLKKYLNVLDESECTTDNKIVGCMSSVYITIQETNEGSLLKGYSDSEVISGILGIICVLIKHDKNPVFEDYKDTLELIKLTLSQNRRLGLANILKKIFK